MTGQAVAWCGVVVGLVGIGVCMICGFPRRTPDLTGAQVGMLLSWFLAFFGVLFALGAAK